ncbi:MAG TPA: hypothetical protein VJG65_04135, partial [Patescibacteria group bacterium]|nr:hypothetical protein [Patescibacteria group bacterium]
NVKFNYCPACDTDGDGYWNSTCTGTENGADCNDNDPAIHTGCPTALNSSAAGMVAGAAFDETALPEKISWYNKIIAWFVSLFKK